MSPRARSRGSQAGGSPSTTWKLNAFDGGQGRNRTTDTRIFSPLSQVLGAYESTTCSACQPSARAHHGTIPAHPT